MIPPGTLVVVKGLNYSPDGDSLGMVLSWRFTRWGDDYTFYQVFMDGNVEEVLEYPGREGKFLEAIQ